MAHLSLEEKIDIMMKLAVIIVWSFIGGWALTETVMYLMK